MLGWLLRCASEVASATNGWQPPWDDKVLRFDGGRPFFHQHDARFTDDGVLLLFDNGTHGAHPPDEPAPLDQQRSYGLGFRIDEAAGTATEVWRFGGDDIAYSGYVGGITQTPNGNRFIACSGIKLEPDGTPSPLPPQGIGSIQLYEITPEGDVVFHARIIDDSAGRDEGWNGFRPHHLPADFLR